MKDYYSILGISREATPEEIKKAFRKLAQKYHPDKQGGDEARFKEASEAYTVLSDAKKKAEYDAYGRTFGGAGGAQGGFGGANPFQDFDFSGFQAGGQGFDFGDIFGDVFGGEARRERRGRDISIDIELSFRDAVFGIERRVLINKVGLCDTCNGNGAAPNSEMDTCKTCNGQGQIRETRRSFFGVVTTNRECPTCDGRGSVPKQPCRTCAGRGVRKREEEIVVQIPAGVNNGEMIRMQGRGEAVAGGVAGDLYIKLHIKNDPRFIREGNNLTTPLNVKLTDALLGAEYTVQTLDGDITVQVPQGTKHNELLRVRGKGVPIESTGSARGDLFVRVNIDFPSKLSRRARKMLEDLRDEGI
jgi:molecular chaperone DnaJ